MQLSQPTTELESSIDKLLKSAKLRDEDIAQTEELMMNHLSVEEVTERRAQLRKMRDLLFRADVKAKRVAKIKSKAYRRIHKKEREKLMAKLDGDATMEDAEEERMKHEAERAKERATLKHKNTGKWAKAMKARGELDEDQRNDVNEMLDRGERLRRKIQGRGSDDDDDGDDSDGSDVDADGEEGVARIKAGAFEELERLEGGDGDDDDGGLGEKTKSVFSMKFMKDAAARQNREVGKMVDDFRKEMGDVQVGSDEEEALDAAAETAVAVERVGGRVSFRPGTQVKCRVIQAYGLLIFLYFSHGKMPRTWPLHLPLHCLKPPLLGPRILCRRLSRAS